MTSEMAKSLQYTIKKYMVEIMTNNSSGNLDGLFSYFILGQNYQNIDWNVICSDNWLTAKKDTIEDGNFSNIASLGFSIYLCDEARTKFDNTFVKGLTKLESKEQFPLDKISFAYIPKAFIGIVLGVASLNAKTKESYLIWLKKIFEQRAKINRFADFQKLIYLLLKAILYEKEEIVDIAYEDNQSLIDLCMVEWGVRRKYLRLQNLDSLVEIRRKALQLFLQTDTNSIETMFVPFVLSSVHSCIMTSVNAIVFTEERVSKILNNFESALKRFKWQIKEEDDVQAIVWLILRSYFDDLVDEDPLRKFGHSFSKPDFGIPSLKLIIEAKYIRGKKDFKKIEGELKKDYVDYLKYPNDYDKLLVFIYDESVSVQEHQTTIQALKQLDGIVDVIIVSKPSQL